MRRTLLFCASIAFAIACGESVTEPVPDRTQSAPPVSFATSTSDDGQLSITTDKDDYTPGDTVHFTGSGWPSDDVVDVQLDDEPATHPPHTWSVAVGSDGTFHDSTYVVDTGDKGVTFTLTATSRSTNRTLTVIFTDGAEGDVTSVSVTPVTVSGGFKLQVSVNASIGKNQEWRTTAYQIQDIKPDNGSVFGTCIDKAPDVPGPTATGSPPPVTGTQSFEIAGPFSAGTTGTVWIRLRRAASCTTNEASDGQWDETNGQFSVAANKSNQTITFNPDPLPNKTYGDPAFNVAATASSGLTVTFEVGATDNCTISGNTVTITGAGSCTVTAKQGGNDDWNAADPVARPFTIGRANLTISVDNKSRKYGESNPPLTGTLTGVVNNDGITASYSTLATQSSPVGHYAITVTLNDPNVRLANYNVPSPLPEGDLEITKAPLTVTLVSPQQIIFGDKPDYSVTYGGFVNLETASVLGGALAFSFDGNLINTTTFVPSVGSHILTVSGLTSANYDITYLPANGATVQVSYDFRGFFTPVDNPGPGNVMNVANSGQAIPLKWQLLDFAGNPVTNLSSVAVTAASLTCALGTTTDLLEEYAAGASGLQNLGNGFYQFNWKTPSSYAKSCKTMKLDLGEGTPRIALFQFKK